MAKNRIIYANGKDLAQCPVTQNDVGRHYKKGSSYYTPVMARFNNATPPSGYVTYNNGSHLQYKNNSFRYPWDIALVGGTKITANFDVKIISATTLNGSWVKAQIVGTDYLIVFVHVDKWARVGTIVKAGNQICKVKSMEGAHLHIDEWTGERIYNLIVKGEFNTMAFKKGDKIIFTDVQNIRKGSGIDYPITGKSSVGQITTIEDGPREADNYTWYDIVGGDWVADISKFKIYTPPPVDPCQDYKDQISALESKVVTLEKRIDVLEGVNTSLRNDLGNAERQIKDLREEKVALIEEVEQCRKEVQIWEDKYATLKIERNRLENEKNDAIKELNECKADKENFIKRLIDKIFDWIRGQSK